jgi:release factor glutamine methyltransferase
MADEGFRRSEPWLLGTIARSERWEICAAATGRSQAWLRARDLCSLEQIRSEEGEGAAALAARMVRAFLDERPIAQIVGHTAFYGRRFWVNASVLIPRSDSECMIDAARGFLEARASVRPGPLRVLDLGTGTGCLAITVALEAKRLGMTVDVVATDLSPRALALARNNALWLGARISFFKGDWTAALPPDCEPFDLILSNPPYLAPTDPHLHQRSLRYEPPLALVGQNQDARGLAAFRLLVPQAQEWLEPGGGLLVEHGASQQSDVAQLMRRAGYTELRLLKDLAERPRAILAHL